MKKLTIAIIIIVILVGVGISYQAFFKKEEAKFSVAIAEISDITEKVSVTGSLVPLQRIDLEPKIQQEVKEVLVEVSDKVEEGKLLIQLDRKDALIQVDKSRASLNSVSQEMNLLETKLKNAEQDLKEVEQTAIKNVSKAEASLEEAKTNLTTKHQNLDDVEEVESNELEQAYEDALALLRGTYLQVDNAYWAVESIQRTYFYQNDQEGSRVKREKRQIELAKENIYSVLEIAQGTGDGSDIDEVLSVVELKLNEVYQSLSVIREICGQTYYHIVADADKTILDTQKSNIDTVISALISAKQDIESQEISSRKNVHSAQATLDIAQSQLDSASSNLSYVETQGQQQITQAQSKIEQLEQELRLKGLNRVISKTNLAQAQKGLEDTSIKAPMVGTVTKVDIERGETAKPGMVVVSMIPEYKYKIEIDVSEVNIGKIKKGGLAKVEFDAFPDETYQGQVDKVYPSEIVKEGVIYYRVEVLLNEYLEKLKSGFTANLDIIIGEKENVITVPYVAVKEDEQGKYVKIVENGEIKEERRVKVGLGSDTRIEIKEGLEQGEEVVLYEEN